MYFSFFTFFTVSHHISYPTVCVFHLQVFPFSYFNPGPTVFISHFFHISTVSHHIPVPRVCGSHFPPISVFCHIPGPTVCIFHVFQCFSRYSRSNSFHISFFTCFRFIAIVQVLQCAFLIFQVFQNFFPYLTSNSVFFSFP